MILDLADKLDDLSGARGPERAEGSATNADAVRALVSLGYAAPDAERAVRAARDTSGATASTAELVRAALPLVGKR